MALCKVNEPTNDANRLSSACERLSISGPDSAAEEPQSDTMSTTVKTQTSGKLRRTALRFLGVRKSICILPTLFGGRSKNQNKWSSKKGLSKSKTHDGISKVNYEENLGCGYVQAGDFEYHSQRHAACLKNSHTELSHTGSDQKSMSLSRQKKGLRGLFQSIKHHKNNRNVELEKNEMIAMSSHIHNKEVPIVQDNANQIVTECLASLSEPNVPDLANVICDLTIAPECIDVNVRTSEDIMAKREGLSALIDNEIEAEMAAVAFSRCCESSRSHSEAGLEPQLAPESAVKGQATADSSYQLNMIFGDVASLKSFDSLTGCGDIIADQDDDSIAESTVSGERVRNGGKRSSCYVTYQGGGEEMASPDELEGDGIRELWGNKESDEVCCTCSQNHSVNLMGIAELSSSQMDLMSSSGALGVTDSSSSYADILTPQSEHQESAPNSDEGYYDSTTPGADEEGHEKVDRIRADRLPRDSYSGDALYELFGPDDTLVSPPYENQSKLSERSEYLDASVDLKEYSSFVPTTDSLQRIGAELYQVHQNLVPGDIKSKCTQSKEIAPFMKGLQDKGLNETNKLNSKSQSSFNKSSFKPQEVEENGNVDHGLHPPKERRLESVNTQSEIRHSDTSFFSTSDPNFVSLASEMPSESKEVSSINASSVTFSDMDNGQAVCFSQALVDFTKHSHLFSNSHNSANGIETSSSFAENMQALPTIVTFDVVDMHNEGEYDQQIHMDMEEDLTSPFQHFEESYLQKDTMAECDYQMLDLHEQSMFSKTWAISSLPRHLSLSRVNRSMPNPLCLNRRSRSLDTDCLELKRTEKYLGSRAELVSFPQSEQDLKRESSPLKKDGHVSSSDNSSIPPLSWQTETERTLSPPLIDGNVTDKTHSLCQTQITHNTVPSGLPCGQFPSSKLQLLSSNASERVLCDFVSQSSGLYNTPCHLPLKSHACLPHSSFVYPGYNEEDLFVKKMLPSDGREEDIFYTSTKNSLSHSQYSKNRPVCITQGMPQSGSPGKRGTPQDEMAFISEARKPMICNKFFPEATTN